MAVKWFFLASIVAVSQTAFASDLRERYRVAPANWPVAQTTDNVAPAPLAPLSYSQLDSSDPKVALGETLFNDTALSADNSVSCATCHAAEQHFADGRGQAVGVRNQVGTRNTPAIFGIDHWQTFFWDGRASTAIDQALMPIENPIEMDLPLPELLTRLNANETYKQRFARVFGAQPITLAQVAEAIVAFERTIAPPSSRYQRFIKQAYSDPQTAVEQLSDSELHGLHLYRTKAKCMTCHEGALLSDNQFHNTGLHNYGRRFEDLGRYDATQDPADIGKFRTPSLLGVSQTGPWMHNGLFVQFAAMLELYNKGGVRPRPNRKQQDDPHFPQTTDLVEPLNLTKAEMADLVSFLNIL